MRAGGGAARGGGVRRVVGVVRVVRGVVLGDRVVWGVLTGVVVRALMMVHCVTNHNHIIAKEWNLCAIFEILDFDF